MNPLNPEAGDTPAPTDAVDLAVVEASARVMWRAFPYFAWRYGERGRAFGRSDAGYLVTLVERDEETARAQVAWLAGALAPRGIPSLLLEVQLESLARVAVRLGGRGAERLKALAARMRIARFGVLDAATFLACEERCWREAHGVACRRGVGRLIAAAVADRALGLGEHDEALVSWLSNAEPADDRWADACRESHAHALARRRVGGSAAG